MTDHLIFQQAIQTQLLIEHLKEVPIGGLVEGAELHTLLGEPCRASWLATARKHLLRQRKILFDGGPIVGLLRLNDQQKVEKGYRKATKHVRNCAKKAREMVASVDSFDELPTESKIRHHTAMAVGSLAIFATSPKQTKKIATEIEEKACAEITVAGTLRLFGTRRDST